MLGDLAGASMATPPPQPMPLLTEPHPFSTVWEAKGLSLDQAPRSATTRRSRAERHHRSCPAEEQEAREKQVEPLERADMATAVGMTPPINRYRSAIGHQRSGWITYYVVVMHWKAP